MKHIFIWIGAIVLVWAIATFFFLPKAHAPAVTEEVPTTSDIQPKLSPEIAETPTDMIEVTSPLPQGTLTSPVIITGKARGPWYFEASFPIELRDANNVLIAKGVAQAQGDWMTENFVPFTATLTFPTQPVGSQGMLTFKNDNPSWEPQNSMMFDVAVTF